MIRVNVMYPATEGSKFDWDYYTGKHIPMVQERLGDALKGATLEQGVGGAAPGTPPVYAAMAHLTFDSVEAFQGAFGAHAGDIMADIHNYTDTTPVIQISEVKS